MDWIPPPKPRNSLNIPNILQVSSNDDDYDDDEFANAVPEEPKYVLRQVPRFRYLPKEAHMRALVLRGLDETLKHSSTVNLNNNP